MRKFKVGDEVIVIEISDVFVIMEVDLNDDYLPYRLNKEALPDWFEERELERKDVYNSPLYQALL